MTLTVPKLSLVVLVGASGSGKSTFARRHFLPTEVLSSDFCRALVSDDEMSLEATHDAFEVLHFIAAKRLAAGKLTVVDATNVQPEARKPLVALARQYHCLPVAIVLDLPERVCQERNRERTGRNLPPHVVTNQHRQLQRGLRALKREGFRYVYTLSSPEEVEAAVIERQALWCDRREEQGPFDIIGDVHGCFDELVELLELLGYQVADGEAGEFGYKVSHPEGRRAIFLGDLVDRGPRIADVLRLVMSMVQAGAAFCVPGNHDMKLVRALRGRKVQVAHGLEQSLAQLEQELQEFRDQVAAFLDGLVSHYVLDDGKLVVAHAGMVEEMQGRGSAQVREFAQYGETTGETDEYGLPVRYNWAQDYRGRAMVVYGHTPTLQPEWVNRTINIDTGCAYGGGLTALRYPERELVCVPAARTYYEPVRPLTPPADAPGPGGDLLDINDVLGKRVIHTRLRGAVTIREENSRAALEVMSRWAVRPEWLIYLPPTMSPSETTNEPGLLEHPAEAFAYYHDRGVAQVVCEQKHMGSRAVVVVCREEQVAAERFGVSGEGVGICYTRTGRRFFADQVLEAAFLSRVSSALGAAGLWEELDTDWVCLDCELMPWSAKAQDLLRSQYAAVGAASRAALADAIPLLRDATSRGVDLGDLLERFEARGEMSNEFTQAYRRYCWPVHSLDDLKLAPFHLLASEGAVHAGQDHLWHMGMLSKVCAEDGGLLRATPHLTVDVTDPSSVQAGTRWWEELTATGEEGMVVKPRPFVATAAGRLLQPALKSRGREYLRLIYGPEYTAPEHLERLRRRGLAAKRSLAVREFALGLEALERFVQREPLHRVHECVFGVLALESEPVDPRL